MKETKLYNMILPPFILFTIPNMLWPISVIGNFIIDSLVIIATLFVLKKLSADAYKKAILRIWLWGYVSDVIGAGVLLITSTISSVILDFSKIDPDSSLGRILYGMDCVVNHSHFDSMWGVLLVILGILFAAISIFIFDYNLVFKKHLSDVLSKKQMIIVSLSMAIFTAPYTFLLPKELFY